MAGRFQEQAEYGVAELYAATGGFHKLCLIGEGGGLALQSTGPAAVLVVHRGGESIFGTGSHALAQQR